MFGGLTIPPEGDIQKPPPRCREWLKYPKKIKRHIIQKYIDIQKGICYTHINKRRY